jgi:hypothetical protein
MTDSGPMFSGITTFVDNSGFTFGVGGGTSIFTPATNVLTFGTNNTEKIRIDASGHMHGVGVITATHFYGDGSNLTGLTVPGGGTGLDLNDNVKIRIGTGTDLELYHDGSHSHINEETGNLLVGVEGEFQVLNRQENEYRIRAHNNGGVDLYYDHTKRFETTAHGASITGKLDLSSDLDMGDNDFIKLGDGDDLTISHDATNSTIHNQTGNLRIRNAGEFQVTKSSTENMLIAKPDGAVELYFNNQKTFSTIQSGVSLGSVTHYLLWPYDGNSNSRSWGWIGEDGAYGKFELKYSNGADTTLDELSIKAIANGTVELYHDNSLKFATHSTGVQVTGDCLVSENVKVNDSKKLIAGSGNDLQIQHNGSHSTIIHNGTGNLNVQASSGSININHSVYPNITTTSQGPEIGDTRHLRWASGNRYWTGEHDNKIQYHSNNLYNQYSTYWIARNSSGSNTFTIDSSGNFSSDVRKKENITTVTDALTKVSQLRGVEFKWKETHGGKEDMGLIAQEVETVLPRLIKDSPDPIGATKENEDGTPMKMLNYNGLFSVMVEAIKELKTKVETLADENIALRARVTSLEGN